MAEQFSWVPLPYCSLPGCPFPINSLALSAHVSPRTTHFRVLDKSPVLGPGRGPPSCKSGVPSPFPRDLLYPGIKPASLRPRALAGGLFTTRATWAAPVSCWPDPAAFGACSYPTRHFPSVSSPGHSLPGLYRFLLIRVHLFLFLDIFIHSLKPHPLTDNIQIYPFVEYT